MPVAKFSSSRFLIHFCSLSIILTFAYLYFRTSCIIIIDNIFQIHLIPYACSCTFISNFTVRIFMHPHLHAPYPIIIEKSQRQHFPAPHLLSYTSLYICSILTIRIFIYLYFHTQSSIINYCAPRLAPFSSLCIYVPLRSLYSCISAFVHPMQ